MKTYINGTLEEFNAREFMDKIYEAKTSLHTNREFGNKVYTIFVFGRPFMAMDDSARWSIDIVVEDENGEQERIGNYNEMSNLTKEECIAKMEEMVKEIIGEEQEEEEMKTALVENEYMNHLKAVAIRYDSKRDAIEDMAEEMKRNGIDYKTVYEIKAKMLKEAKPDVSNGESKAYRAWQSTIAKNRKATILEMSDFLWETEVAGFVLALRTAGIKKFYYTNTSSAVMENLHGFTAAGCKIGNTITIEEEDYFHEMRLVLGIEITL